MDGVWNELMDELVWILALLHSAPDLFE